MNRCAKISKEELALQPWFLPARISRKVRWLLPPDFRQRLRDYFIDYGCMRCDRKDVSYKSNGMCRKCLMLVFDRLQRSEVRRSATRLQRRYGHEFVAKAKEAQKLLRGISRHGIAAPRRPQIKAVRLGSPVIDAFDRYSE